MDLLFLYLVFQADAIGDIAYTLAWVAVFLTAIPAVSFLIHSIEHPDPKHEDPDHIWNKGYNRWKANRTASWKWSKTGTIMFMSLFAFSALVPTTQNLILIYGIHTITTSETVDKLGSKSADAFEQMLNRYLESVEVDKVVDKAVDAATGAAETAAEKATNAVNGAVDAAVDRVADEVVERMETKPENNGEQP